MREKFLVTKQEAYKFLNVQAPFTLETLKTAYKSAAMKAHPDKGGDNLTFAKVKSSFDLLSKDCVAIVSVEDEQKKTTQHKFHSSDKTVEGHNLTDLGHGKVGPTCISCTGKGYTSITSDKVEKCVCNKVGASIFSMWKCSKGCGGTGFIKSGKILRHFFCRTCEGEGRGYGPYNTGIPRNRSPY